MRLSRLATALSRRAQSRTASSIFVSSRLDPASADSRRSLALAPALALDAIDHLVDDQPLPRVEHLLQQRGPVLEVPVEAALRDAERLRRLLDSDGVGAADAKGP